MARLYDRLLVNPEDLTFGPDAHARSGLSSVIPALRRRELWEDCVVLDATEPTNFFISSGRHIWEPGDFPNIAPPCPRLFIEISHPELQVGFTNTNLRVRRWGVLYSGREASDEDKELGYGWRCLATLVCEFGNAILPLALGPVDVAPNGSFITAPEMIGKEQWTLQSFYDPDSAGYEGVLIQTGMIVFGAALFAVSLMHCKNVQSREVEQPQWDRREWQRKHKRPLVRYHVLDIDPMRKVLKHEGGSDVHGLKKALHICRGHFATYTNENPLFGRITGTFWRPQHIRGDLASGLTVKDYRVKAPR